MHPIIIPTSELRPALAGLSKIIPRRSTLPVLSHIRIKRTATGQLELAGSDLESAAIVQIDAPQQGEPIVFLVPFSDLNNVVKRCGRGDLVHLTPTDKDRVSIQFPAGNQSIEHRCQTLPAEEFPPIPEVSGTPAILGEAAQRAIREAFDCASDDSTRLILNGAHIDVSKPGTHYVVATDGRHLFSSNSFSFSLKESVTIPNHRFLSWRDFQEDGDWQIRTASTESATSRLELASRHWRFIASSLEGIYPNWRQVVPSASSFQATIEFTPAALAPALTTIERMPDHDPANHTIGLEVKQGALSLLGKSAADEPWRRIELQGVTVSGTDVTTFLNRHFLAKALRFGLTKVELIDATSPLRFSEGGRQMVVMPTRTETPPIRTAPAPGDINKPALSGSAQPADQTTMPETNTQTAGGASRSSATTDPKASDRPALEAALAQIETIKGSYREAIRGLTSLADLLRQAARDQKNNDKEILSVRQTIRSLQSVRI